MNHVIPGTVRTRGFALLIVLWFLVLIAAIATYLLVNARMEIAIARNIRSSAAAEALADAGIAEALFNETDPLAANHWRLDGAPHRLRFAAGEVTIRITDENGKVNPNYATDGLLAALLEAAGIEQMQARRLGAAIADWVGPPSAPRPLGAKLQQYAAAGKSYGPPNAPAESLDELQLVLGMTPQIFAAVRPYLTIYTETGMPDPSDAPALVQRALVLAEREPVTEPPIGAGTAPDATVADNSGATNPDKSAAPPGAASGEPETVLSVESIARLPDGGIFVRDAVMKIDPDSPKGYDLRDWRRGNLDQ